MAGSHRIVVCRKALALRHQRLPAWFALHCRAPRQFSQSLALAITVVLMLTPASFARSTLDVGRSAYIGGRYQEAVSAFQSHIRTRPRDAEAWTWLGAAHYQLQQFHEADAAFQWAAAIHPTGEVALWLGATEVRLQKLDAARQAFALAAQIGRPQIALWARQWLRMMQGRAIGVLGPAAAPEAYGYVVRWYNQALSPSQVDAIVRSVLYYSHTYHVDPRLVMALIAVESGFQIMARSPAGAYGLGQLMPDTWRALGIHPGDPVANIYGTVRVLRSHLERFGFDPALALAAYNAGRGAVELYAGIPPFNETQWYVYNVLTLYRHFAGG